MVCTDQCTIFVTAETVCSTTSDSEECLRPSLLRKRRKPGPDTAPSTPHCENTPANHQIPAHWQTKTSSSLKTAVHQQPHHFPSDACCSPVQQTPFAPLSPSCPSTGAPSRCCLSPAAEHDLFGSPAASTLTGLSPACNTNTFESPVGHKQTRHEAGPSKALAHISRLQRDRARLLQDIKVCLAALASLPGSVHACFQSSQGRVSADTDVLSWALV